MTNNPIQRSQQASSVLQLVNTPRQNYYAMARPVYVNLLSPSGWNNIFVQGHCRKQFFVLLRMLLKGVLNLQKIKYVELEQTPEDKLSNFRNIKIVLIDKENREFCLDKNNLTHNGLLPCFVNIARIDHNGLGAGGEEDFINGTNITFDNLRIDCRPPELPCVQKVYFHPRLPNGEKAEAIPAVYIEMHEFHKSLEQLRTERDKWLYLLKNLGSMTKIPAIYNNKFFKPIFKYAKFSRLSDVEKKKYSNLRIEY